MTRRVPQLINALKSTPQSMMLLPAVVSVVGCIRLFGGDVAHRIFIGRV